MSPSKCAALENFLKFFYIPKNCNYHIIYIVLQIANAHINVQAGPSGQLHQGPEGGLRHGQDQPQEG